MKTKDRYEIIDSCDMVCATADTLEDAKWALSNKKEANQVLHARSYIYDTVTKKKVGGK